jgi:hypothetical protein
MTGTWAPGQNDRGPAKTDAARVTAGEEDGP